MTPSLLTLWRSQVETGPRRVAVVCGQRTMTYAELDEQSDRLAARLVALGVGDDDRVGICLQRSPEVPVAVLAVLKAGAGYLPLDPRYPAERLAFMLADGDVRVLLTHRELRKLVPFDDTRTLCLDEDSQLCNGAIVPLVAARDCDDLLAYVIYTSGSTGRPKGVAMGRAALAGGGVGGNRGHAHATVYAA